MTSPIIPQDELAAVARLMPGLDHYPGEHEKHCSKCELPRAACACADAREYDRWWQQIGRHLKDQDQ